MGTNNGREEIIFAGFGGQGIMLLGKLVAFSAMREGKRVTFLPSYGAEVRGGTAHCDVIISSEEIASPIISACTTLVVMNQPSLVKFEPKVRPGGLIMLNSTLVFSEPERKDVEVIRIPATQMADEMGSIRCANVIMLGCLLVRKGIAGADKVIEGLHKSFPRDKKKIVELNIQAFEKGKEFFESLAQKQDFQAK